MIELPKGDETGVVEDLETGTQLITSDHPNYASYVSMLRGDSKSRGAAALAFSKSLLRDRRNLNLAELLDSKNHKARFEQAFPEVRTEEGRTAYFYTFDGIDWDGAWMRGALFAGSCMLIFAMTRHQADALANEGLHYTLDRGHAVRLGINTGPIVTPELEFGGRKGDSAAVNPDTLKSDPRMKEKIINSMENRAARRKKMH